MLTVLGGLAEYERHLILARTSEGRSRAKLRGIRFGRRPKLTPHQRAEALDRRAAGETLVEIAKSYNVHDNCEVYLKRLGQSSIFQDAVGRVPGLQVCRDCNLLAGVGIVPNVVVAFAMTEEFPSGLFQLFPYFPRIAFRAGIVACPSAINSNGTSRSPLPSNRSSIALGSLL